MKKIAPLIIALILCLLVIMPAHAQTSETIWITASANSFKTGETLIVAVNAISATSIQGFTFQIRYDPACLEPVNAASPIVGMNGLSLPQIDGVVDASFASTIPQTANGILAEARFVTLGACETTVTLESAAIVIKSDAGFAVPLEGVVLGEKAVPFSVSAEKGTSQDVPLLGTPMALGVETDTATSILPNGMVIVLTVIGLLLIVGIFILIRILKGNQAR